VTSARGSADSNWKDVLDPDLRSRAIRAALDSASRLRDRRSIEEAVRACEQQTGFPKSVHWQPATVAQGYSGLALMHGCLHRCFPDQGWDEAAHRCLQLAVWAAEGPAKLLPGLFSGFAGVAFTASYLTPPERYSTLVSAIETPLCDDIRSLVETPPGQSGVSAGVFDVISGASGIGAYLLRRRDDRQVCAALEAIVLALTRLTELENGLPRWRTPVQFMVDESMAQHYPHGNLNCGLAHGIPGVIAFLSLCSLHDVNVDGQRDAISRTSQWLAESRCDDVWGINWPNAVALEQGHANGYAVLRQCPPADAPFGPSRAGWCYGAPGIARALWLAGTAIDNQPLCDLAVAAMEAVYRRPVSERRIDSPSFCHGVAGLLQITLRFAADTRAPVFTRAARELVEQILSLYVPDSRLGFQNVEPGGRLVDQPGLLDGAPGIVMTLLSAATREVPAWDRIFLLS